MCFRKKEKEIKKRIVENELQGNEPNKIKILTIDELLINFRNRDASHLFIDWIEFEGAKIRVEPGNDPLDSMYGYIYLEGTDKHHPEKNYTCIRLERKLFLTNDTHIVEHNNLFGGHTDIRYSNPIYHIGEQTANFMQDLKGLVRAINILKKMIPTYELVTKDYKGLLGNITEFREVTK